MGPKRRSPSTQRAAAEISDDGSERDFASSRHPDGYDDVGADADLYQASPDQDDGGYDPNGDGDDTYEPADYDYSDQDEDEDADYDDDDDLVGLLSSESLEPVDDDSDDDEGTSEGEFEGLTEFDPDHDDGGGGGGAGAGDAEAELIQAFGDLGDLDDLDDDLSGDWPDDD